VVGRNSGGRNIDDGSCSDSTNGDIIDSDSSSEDRIDDDNTNTDFSYVIFNLVLI
jgi:hypothetical protein